MEELAQWLTDASVEENYVKPLESPTQKELAILEIVNYLYKFELQHVRIEDEFELCKQKKSALSRSRREAVEVLHSLITATKDIPEVNK